TTGHETVTTAASAGARSRPAAQRFLDEGEPLAFRLAPANRELRGTSRARPAGLLEVHRLRRRYRRPNVRSGRCPAQPRAVPWAKARRRRGSFRSGRRPWPAKYKRISALSECAATRSEEHTSELQSRENLVCRR